MIPDIFPEWHLSLFLDKFAEASAKFTNPGDIEHIVSPADPGYVLGNQGTAANEWKDDFFYEFAKKTGLKYLLLRSLRLHNNFVFWGGVCKMSEIQICFNLEGKGLETIRFRTGLTGKYCTVNWRVREEICKTLPTQVFWLELSTRHISHLLHLHKYTIMLFLFFYIH